MSLALTRIRLHGFKTFAQRTEIDLSASLTAVVGPNGCGKSNLVDALVWALGEANVRTLRAQTPTEVLFSGSAAHKPLGLAEVSLWFNNESRWLPLDADEVQITRRLYRSGEWECWINRTPARLRDLADLFAGTGLGRGGYSIVGQGDIDALLTAPPDERRRWLEEVAGVALYRARRKDALRDLESARMHLTRVEDVLRELERQREPMRQEAERALVYRELQRQLAQLEREYLQYEYRLLRQRLHDAQTERDALHEQIVQTELAIAEQETHADAYGREIAQLESAMDTLRTVLQSQLTAEERALGELNRLHERERALAELAQTLQEEAENLHAQQSERAASLESLQRERAQVDADAESLAPKVRHAEAETEQLRQQLRDTERAYQHALRQRAEREQARQQAERLQQDAAQARAQLDALHAEADALQNALTEAQAHEAALHAQHDALDAEQGASEQTLQSLLRAAQRDQRTVETLRARVHALDASLQAGEGASPAVRALLQAVQRGELQGDYMPVGAAISVPEAYQAAIGAALGGAVNDILTPTEAQARAAVEWLKARRAGRLTFLPLDLVRPSEPPRDAIPNDAGVLGIAAALVQYDPRFEPAVRHLLGRVLIVDTLETATRLVRQLRQSRQANAFARIAALDGSVVQLSGAITGGAHAGERSSLLTLKGELERARAELQHAEAQLQHTETALESHRAQHTERQQTLERVRQQHREATQTRMRLENEMRQKRREIQHHESLLQRAQEQHAALEAVLNAPPEADLAVLEAEQERLQRALDEELRALAEGRAQLQQLQHRQRELHRQIEAETRAVEQMRLRQQSRAERLQSLQQEQAQILTQRAALERELARIRAQIQHAQAELDAQRAQRQALLEQSFAVNDRIRALRATLSQLAERERALELHCARAEVRLTELQERWRPLAPDEPLPDADDAPLPDKPPVARAELERMRRALAEMGEVNLAAADEYARLTERCNHLERQRGDLEQTCDQLLQQLREIDAHAREQFLNTFEAVRAAFQTRFQQLFEGGQAELILTDANDPLSAGVLIEAQPPGKRRQRLELLSGGERALTAIALLFAFSTVKPSPLMALDEVDAALDGRNVQRFADYLQQMAEQSQVLIVTHNPITTAVARQWLGVSMTGGVSRVVPYTPPEAVLGNGIDAARAAVVESREPAAR
ncbi:MAG: chromosome segregation protein SMC [Fimbriimonadales bacterium]|nr:MAG: chromosome partition protein Smc [Fimbriimonadales bacterium]